MPLAENNHGLVRYLAPSASQAPFKPSLVHFLDGESEAKKNDKASPMLSKEDNELSCSVGPGTPMGNADWIEATSELRKAFLKHPELTPVILGNVPGA